MFEFRPVTLIKTSLISLMLQKEYVFSALNVIPTKHEFCRNISVIGCDLHGYSTGVGKKTLRQKLEQNITFLLKNIIVLKS